MRLLLAGIALLALAGCDPYDSTRNPDPISASGTVVLAETGEPIVGLGVSITRITSGIQSLAASTQTDANGRFMLSYDPPGSPGAAVSAGYGIQINRPYDQRYTVGGRVVSPGQRIDFGMVELSRNPPP